MAEQSHAVSWETGEEENKKKGGGELRGLEFWAKCGLRVGFSYVWLHSLWSCVCFCFEALARRAKRRYICSALLGTYRQAGGWWCCRLGERCGWRFVMKKKVKLSTHSSTG